MTGQLSLYVHIPFCVHKCSYCDFYSLAVGARPIPGERYMECLVNELNEVVQQQGLAGNELAGREVGSIFFGGGTPSMIEPALFKQVINAARSHFKISDDCEITCEANPETVDLERLASLRASGINRMSFGVQSFQERHLKFLERIHSAERAEEAVRAAQSAGFDNVSLDLIFGLPDQTDQELEDDLQRALALKTQHISAYQLTVEPNTPLAQYVKRGNVTPITNDRSHEMWLAVRARLADSGYEAYEVSNYSLPGFHSVHNLHYWRCGDYLGIGTGAVSRIGSVRWRRARHLADYLAGKLRVDEEEILTVEQQRLENLMLGLRTREGIDVNGNADLHSRWQAAGYLEKAAPSNRIILNVQGLAVLDSLLAD